MPHGLTRSDAITAGWEFCVEANEDLRNSEELRLAGFAPPAYVAHKQDKERTARFRL